MTALKRRSKRFHRERSRSGVFALEIAKNHLSLLYKSSLHFTNQRGVRILLVTFPCVYDVLILTALFPPVGLCFNRCLKCLEDATDQHASNSNRSHSLDMIIIWFLVFHCRRRRFALLHSSIALTSLLRCRGSLPSQASQVRP